MFHDEDVYPSTRQEKAQDAAEIRKIDLLHQEARDRALREIAARLGDVRGHLMDRNYGLADDAVWALLERLYDEQGPPPIVQDHLDTLMAGTKP